MMDMSFIRHSCRGSARPIKSPDYALPRHAGATKSVCKLFYSAGVRLGVQTFKYLKHKGKLVLSSLMNKAAPRVYLFLPVPPTKPHTRPIAIIFYTPSGQTDSTESKSSITSQVYKRFSQKLRMSPIFFNMGTN
jgi:hypothetical protein